MGDVRWRMEAETGTRPRPRIESLSDLVFGLALSIGAIALVSNPPTTVHGLYNDIVTFAFNFLVLISLWLRYTRIMSALPVETRGTMLLNSGLLFGVAMEPFLYNILRSGNSATPAAVSLFEAASSLYGLDLGMMMLIMGIFTIALADEEKHLVPAAMTRQLRFESTTWFVSAGIFLISAIPLFGRMNVSGILVSGLSVRTLLWLIAVLVVWVRRNVRKTVLSRAAGTPDKSSGAAVAAELIRKPSPGQESPFLPKP
jgi:uncharacterized membrane protein